MTSVRSDSDLLAGLNPAQREAVCHVDGPLLVLAGAGSGKTRVLTSRIARLIEQEGVDPQAILAVTFTNKAAGEMRSRIARLLGAEPAGMWCGTFHGIGARFLRTHALRDDDCCAEQQHGQRRDETVSESRIVGHSAGFHNRSPAGAVPFMSDAFRLERTLSQIT